MNSNSMSQNLLCEQHKFVAYDICLHENPMKNRLLCRLCKSGLAKEQLLDVISLSDFISGNFMTIIDDLAQQSLNHTAEGVLPDHVNSFYEDVLNSLDQSKELTSNMVKKQSIFNSSGSQVEEKKKALATRLAQVQDNWDENITNDELLNEIALYSSDLTKLLTFTLERTFSLDRLAAVTDLNKKTLQRVKKELNNYQVSLMKCLENDNLKPPLEQCNPHHTRSRRQPLGNIKDEKKVFKKIKVMDSDKMTTTSITETSGINSPSNHSVNSISSDMGPQIKLSHSLIDRYNYVLCGGLCYVEDENHLVTAGAIGKVNVWDIKSKKLLYTRKTDAKQYMAIYVKNKGTVVVAGSDGKVRIFDAKSNYELLYTFQVHKSQAFSIVYLQDFNFYASCEESGGISLWNYNEESGNWFEIRALDTNKKPVASLCYVEDQKVLVCGLTKGGSLMAFNPDKPKNFKVVKAHLKEKSIDSIIYVPEWKQLISGSADACIKFWDFADKDDQKFLSCLKTLRRENSCIECLAVDAEKNYLFHANLDNHFTIWDLSQNQIIKEVSGCRKSDHGEALLYLKDHGEMVTAFGQDIKFWDISFPLDKTDCLQSSNPSTNA